MRRANEKVLKSEEVTTKNGVKVTVLLTRSAKDKEYFRYIESNDPDWNVEMGFSNRKKAVARYERDLAGLKK